MAPAAVLSLCVIAGAVSQLSEAVADPVAPGAVEVPHSTVTFAGHVMTGAVLSTTLIVCTQVAVLPHSSFAVNVRVMVAEAPHPAALLSLNITQM